MKRELRSGRSPGGAHVVNEKGMDTLQAEQHTVGPATSAIRIHAARKDSPRRAAEMADVDDAHVLQREGRQQGLP